MGGMYAQSVATCARPLSGSTAAWRFLEIGIPGQQVFDLDQKDLQLSTGTLVGGNGALRKPCQQAFQGMRCRLNGLQVADTRAALHTVRKSEGFLDSSGGGRPGLEYRAQRSDLLGVLRPECREYAALDLGGIGHAF